MKFLLSGGKAGTVTADKIPFVIFSDSKRYWNIFKPVCDEFEKSPYDSAWLKEDMWTSRILPSIGIPLKEEDFDNIKKSSTGP